MERPSLLWSCKRGLPQYLNPESIGEMANILNHIAIPINDVLVLAKTNPNSLLNSYGTLCFPWIPKDVKIWLVMDDLSYATSRSGTAENLQFQTERGRMKLTKNEFWEIVDLVSKGRTINVILPAEPPTGKVGSNRTRRILEKSDYFYNSERAEVMQYYPVAVFENAVARKASVAKFKAQLKRYAGVFLDGLAYQCCETPVVNEHVETIHNIDSFSRITDIVATTREGLGTMLSMLESGVTVIQMDFPSEAASDDTMIFIQMLPSDTEIANYFGLAPYLEPRATATCATVEREKEAFSTILNAESIDVSQVNFRALSMKDERLRDNYESATCLNAILKHVGYGGSATVEKDYTFGALHHMAVCNEPNVQQVLEWHNWTLLGLLFKLGARIQHLKGKTIFKQWLRWVALINDIEKRAIVAV